jgi:hypothetical protein
MITKNPFSNKLSHVAAPIALMQGRSDHHYVVKLTHVLSAWLFTDNHCVEAQLHVWLVNKHSPVPENDTLFPRPTKTTKTRTLSTALTSLDCRQDKKNRESRILITLTVIHG